jgi:hypothetical protein
MARMSNLKPFTPAALLLSAAFLLRAGDPPPAAAPRAEVPVASFDAGTVLASQPVRHDYVIKNTGSAPLTIKDVKPG